MSLEINSKINSILQERTQLQNKVGTLEEKLKGLSQNMVPPEQISEISTLKDVIEAQEKTITNLLQAVKEQHDQLDNQKLKIKNLEENLSNDNFQDTMEKSMESDLSSPDMFEYLTENSTDLPTDCSELYDKGEVNSGVYVIRPNHSEPFNVYCEMTPYGGATVVQRRVDGTVNFDQTWEKYEKGFGNFERDYWLGLQKFYSVAQQGPYILRVDLEDWRDGKHWAEYRFSLDGPSKHYTIHLSHVAGDTADALANITGTQFSTKDMPNDNHRNCPRHQTGGWWFDSCGETNLNGRCMWLRAKGRLMKRRVIHWRPSTGPSFSLKTTKMSVRPAPYAS